MKEFSGFIFFGAGAALAIISLQNQQQTAIPWWVWWLAGSLIATGLDSIIDYRIEQAMNKQKTALETKKAKQEREQEITRIIEENVREKLADRLHRIISTEASEKQRKVGMERAEKMLETEKDWRGKELNKSNYKNVNPLV
jgi:hypothetical protein